MEDILARLRNGNTFSKINLRQAYLQIPDKTCRKLTNINTSKGICTYNMLPFGKTSSPAIWQRKIDTILQGLPSVECNQDDMIVTGISIHHKNLEGLLQRLFDYGLKANLEKCRFLQNSEANANANILSRLLLPSSDSFDATDNADGIFYSEILEQTPIKATTVAKESQHDPTVFKFIHFLRNDSWPDSVNISICSSWSRQNEENRTRTSIKKLKQSQKVVTAVLPNRPILCAHNFIHGDDGANLG
ncbi:reverse transcriptase [Elysia marginata]|uniref:Reverse transcriptase n=1 Tax=Elysia marginata TaxID=1093978 RepID=A0AAV4GTN9_9GAST|nr:reverse transcriptase [Elysia marginata]